MSDVPSGLAGLIDWFGSLDDQHGSSKGTCPSDPSYGQLSNQKGQDPCSVALSLSKTCNPNCDDWPCIIKQTKGSNSPCACNTVLYSLYDVCFRCAPSSPSLKFTDYTKYLGCQSTLSQAYPESIPTDTPIPAWAYEPLGDDGHVNLQLALQVANQHQPDETVSGSYQETQPSPTATPSPPNPSPPANTIQVTTTSEGRSVQRTTSVTTSTSTQGPGNAGSPAQAPPPTGSLSTRIDEPSSNPPSVRSTGSTPPAAPSITLSPERTSQNKDPTSSNGAALSGGATPADETPHSTSIAGAADSSPRRSGDLASILGGVFGALAAVAVAIALVYWLVRRRRLRREKEAMLMCPPLDWWKQPEFPHPWPGHELSESATIKTENSDFDDMETLHATSMEKKSVTYGEYPDI